MGNYTRQKMEKAAAQNSGLADSSMFISLQPVILRIPALPHSSQSQAGGLKSP